MRIGIVMPAHNVAPFIGQAIRSVLAQTHADWTLVVVDDGSTDTTASVAAGFGDSRMHLIRQANAGVSAARNRGMAALNGDALLFLDADDWLAPQALAVLAGTLAQHPEAVAAIGAYARTAAPAGAVSRGSARFRRPAGDLLSPLLLRNQFANGGHLLVARHAAGRFREDLRFGEDWEYWVRLALRGPFAAVPNAEPLCFIRERPGGASLSLGTDPAAIGPCLDAIFANPELVARFGAARLATFRRQAETEYGWAVGRELIRHGRRAAGRAHLRHAMAASISPKRVALLLAAHALPLLPAAWRGPFRPYP